MKNILGKVFLIICTAVFLVSAGILGKYLLEARDQQKEMKDLAEMKTEQEEFYNGKGTVVGRYVDLYHANNDIIGWVKIKDTRIDYPVMQTPDNNEYYLHRNFEREYSGAGTPFMDVSSSVFIPTSNFLVYGHNMDNGNMFHDLLKYRDEDFYKTHKKFKFDTIYKGGQGTYEILAAGYSKIYPTGSDEFKYYHYGGITTEEEFYEYVNGVKNLSIYDTGVTAEYGDQLVTLSTCAYHVKNGRFFIVGKRIK